METQRQVHLFFNRLLSENYLDGIKDSLMSLQIQVIPCKSWDELSNLLKLDVVSICFHNSELQFCSAVEIISMVETLCKLVGNKNKITITVGLSKSCSYNTVKEFKKTSILGIIPAWVDFGFTETLIALEKQWNNEPYWPVHILEHLPDYKKKKNKVNLTLTPRQSQICKLIKDKGHSNKSIARILGITESTVKLHIGSILKKYGLKNRTQLVLFVK